MFKTVSGSYVHIGHIPGMMLVNMNDIQDGDEIIYGNDTYKIWSSQFNEFGLAFLK